MGQQSVASRINRKIFKRLSESAKTKCVHSSMDARTETRTSFDTNSLRGVSRSHRAGTRNGNNKKIQQKKRSEKHGPANGLKTTSFQFPQRISIPTSPQYGMSRGNCTLLSWCCENILGYVSSWIDPPSGFVIFTYRKGLKNHKFQNSTFYLKP